MRHINSRNLLLALRILAFIPPSPLCGVGRILLALCLEDWDDDGLEDEKWNHWPLEFRCLFGYPAFFIGLGQLIAFGGYVFAEKLRGNS